LIGVRGLISAGAIVAASVILGQGAIRDAATAVIGVAALLAIVAVRRWRPPRLERLVEPLVVVVAGIAGVLLRGA
jgi:hypothetical protein